MHTHLTLFMAGLSLTIASRSGFCQESSNARELRISVSAGIAGRRRDVAPHQQRIRSGKVGIRAVASGTRRLAD